MCIRDRLDSSRKELKASVDLAISQSEQPGADSEIEKIIDRINEIDLQIARQDFILSSLNSELEKLPIKDAQKMQQFETLYDEFKKIVKGLDRFAEKWNAEVEILEGLLKKEYPNFVRFLQLTDNLVKLGQELKDVPNLYDPEIVKYSYWGAIDLDIDCPFRLWRLFSRIPKNGEHWLNRRMRNGQLIEVEN